MSSNNSTQQYSSECACQCGNTQFTVKNKPLLRIYCHCEICQAFNDAPFSDVSIFLRKDIELHNNESLSFKAYKSPPALNRGRCSSCHQPAMEFFNMPLLPSLAIIPNGMLSSVEGLPEPSSHIFYHRRVSDINDALPKRSGYIKSQVVFLSELVFQYFRRLIF